MSYHCSRLVPEIYKANCSMLNCPYQPHTREHFICKKNVFKKHKFRNQIWYVAFCRIISSLKNCMRMFWTTNRYSHGLQILCALMEPKLPLSLILGKWPTWRTNSFLCIYSFIYNSLHVSSTWCSSSGETNCINTASGNCHSVLVAVSCAGWE